MTLRWEAYWLKVVDGIDNLFVFESRVSQKNEVKNATTKNEALGVIQVVQ